MNKFAVPFYNNMLRYTKHSCRIEIEDGTEKYIEKG